jgi:hypothetical protein
VVEAAFRQMTSGPEPTWHWSRPPPQPRDMSTNARISNDTIRVIRLRPPAIKHNPNTAKLADKSHPGECRGRDGMFNPALNAVVVICRFADAAAPLSTNVAGLKTHAAPVGSPEHASAIDPLKLFCATAFTE